MCFDANGNMAKNQTEFSQDFNNSTGIGPAFGGMALAMRKAVQARDAQQQPASQPTQQTAPVQPAAQPVSAPTAVTGATPSAAPASVADTLRQAAPAANFRQSSTPGLFSSGGSGRVVN